MNVLYIYLSYALVLLIGVERGRRHEREKARDEYAARLDDLLAKAKAAPRRTVLVTRTWPSEN